MTTRLPARGVGDRLAKHAASPMRQGRGDKDRLLSAPRAAEGNDAAADDGLDSAAHSLHFGQFGHGAVAI